MKYDCIIIGGGISGLTCAIKCQSEGLRCAVVSAGMGALHFSSGSIDLLGYKDDRRVVYSPFEELESFTASHPEHPYARCGVPTIREAFFFLKEQLEKEGLELFHNGDLNHFHVTALGTLKPSFFSQRSVFSDGIRKAFQDKPRIAVLNFEGYRDFYPELAVANLKTHPLFRDIELVTGRIVFPDYGDPEKNPFEFRSIDIARIFDTEKYLEDIAGQIRKAAAGAAFAGLPAFIGISNYTRHYRILQDLAGVLIYEIPTLPPSILGMRIDDALKSRFAALGGIFIAGDKVTAGDTGGGRVNALYTENGRSTPLEAGCYVLATGSFFSGGMVSEFNKIREPVFGLRVHHDDRHSLWYAPQFLDAGSHPFLEYGVETDGALRPYDAQGRTLENLYCTGALLAHYNPLKEGSGGGVAVSTGYLAAASIVKECRGRHD